jgi:uncharacterized protein (DUF1800 family)
MDLRAAAIAANRFGFGARPGELAKIAGDPRGWVKSQMGPRTDLPPQIAALPATEDNDYAEVRARIARQMKNGNANLQPRVAEIAQRRMADSDAVLADYRGRYPTAVRARIEAALTSDAPAYERQVHFWSNHFTVSAAKNQAAAFPASFERDVIRPHVGGSFAAMLQASTRHPGMIVYLDNWLSIGPNSKWAKNPAARPPGPQFRQASGLNENLGREILELHTLGVNGGYTQADVQALAKIITGWTYLRQRPLDVIGQTKGARDGGEMFTFARDAHEPGAQTLLGKSYPDNGEAQGTAALNDLARHPATARFIATKLARHYIADDPPPAAIARIAAALQTSGGDLKQTMFAVIDSPEAWADPLAKFKQPEEYAISIFRALNTQTLGQNPGAAAQSLTVMGQPVYRAPGPNGWDDHAASWLSADLVWKRLEWAQVTAQRIARADIDPTAIGDNVLGPLLSEDTKQAIARAQSPMQATAILFACPEFQRR